MSALLNFSLDLSKLPKGKIIKGKKGQYINLTASINDETKFGNNVSFSVSQSKEEREGKETKIYVGNGKVVWNDGNIVNAEKQEQEPVNSVVDSGDDLPF
tara:strand:- start:581 stop:880 length:300 start_codon:yes stop_codon:yes gene_type:complete